jgi:SAM-dependent methyltransferase
MVIKTSDIEAQHDDIGERYGEDYLSWKKWEDPEFGNLKKHQFTYFAAEIAKTKRSFNKNSKVLEIGFGNGNFLKFAEKQDWRVVGTEVNERLVQSALSAGYNALHADNLKEFEDNTFDLIVAFDVLEHLAQEEIAMMLSEINRILKNDGCFVARFPNGDSPFGLINQNGDATHITSIGSAKVRYLANQVNMEVVFVGGEALPILRTSFRHFMHRIVAVPIQKLINRIINLIFFPGGNVAFCSLNLVMVFKAVK